MSSETNFWRVFGQSCTAVRITQRWIRSTANAPGKLPARPSGAHTSIAIYRCEVADCGTRPTDSDQKKNQE
jgi:hypothetical protein